MHGVMVVGEAIKNGFGMTARWNLANGYNSGDDHGMFNNGEEPDGVLKWNPRPVFYHLFFFQKFLGDRLVTASVGGNTQIDAYASRFTSGQAGLTLVNKSATSSRVEIKFNNYRIGNCFYWYVLSGGDDNGEFSRKVFVNGQGPAGVAGGPPSYTSLKLIQLRHQKGSVLKFLRNRLFVLRLRKSKYLFEDFMESTALLNNIASQICIRSIGHSNTSCFPPATSHSPLG